MAERALFFDAIAGDRTYYSSDFAKAFQGITVTNGVANGLDNSLVVELGSDLTVQLHTGGAWINGRFYYNDASKTMAVSTPDLFNSRVDRVVVKLDCNSGVRTISAYIKAGTANGSLTPPDLQRDNFIYEISLYKFTVAPEATAPINLVDERSSIAVCGYAKGLSASNLASFSIDFGDQDTYCSTTITGLTNIRPNSTITWRMSATQTDPDRDLEDAAMEGIMMNFGNIVSGSSLDVFVYAPDGAQGVYNFDIIYF